MKKPHSNSVKTVGTLEAMMDRHKENRTRDDLNWPDAKSFVKFENGELVSGRDKYGNSLL